MNNLKTKLCNYLIQNNLVKENDVIRHSYSTSRMKEWKKRNVETNNYAPTLDTRCDCLEVVVKDNIGRIETKYKEYTNFYVIPRGSDGKLINGSYNRVWKKEKHCGAINLTKIQEIGEKDDMNNLRIRKLTPKECWRLMGFDDEDFEKAEQVNSNTQLYKQAGNSIVVNVLEAILTNLLLTNEQTKTERQTTIFDYLDKVS